MLSDIRYAIRSLLRTPGFTAVAVLTLGLGIGATAAIFTLLDAIVLNPLRYPDSDQLVSIESSVPGTGPGATWGISTAGYFEFHDRLTTASSIGAFFTSGMALAQEDGAEGISTGAVTASLLPVLGARAEIGRLVDERDTPPGSEPVMMLSHGYWMTRFGGDRSIVGRSVLLEGGSTRIIGVMAPGVELPSRKVDVWVPLLLDRSARPVNAHWLSVIGRTKPGVTLADLQADLNRITATFTERFPSAYDEAFMRESQFATTARSLRDEVIGSHARTLWILLGAVGLVLCIAAANVSSLLLVRAESRRTELRIRRALGATRTRITAHLLAESVSIALIASAVGVLLADAALRALLAIGPDSLPRLEEVVLGPTTVGFGVLVALIAGIVSGLLPVFQSNGGATLGAMSSVAVGRIHGQHQPIMRNALVIGQIALAVMLLAGAGLLFRSFARMNSVDPGMNPQGVLTAELSLPWSRYQSYPEVVEFYRALTEQVKQLPAVEAAGILGDVPVLGFDGCSSVFIEGQPLGPGDTPPCVTTQIAAPGTFSALGIPVRGNEPRWSDLDGGTGAVVVTPALANRFWPGEDPIGKGIRGNGDGPPYYRVAGVTGDLRARGLDQPPVEAVFFPLRPIEGAQLWAPLRAGILYVRTSSGDPASLAGLIRRAVAEIDPLVATGSIETMDHLIRSSESMARVSFTMILLGVAAGIALILSMVSIYGVISYVVGQRRGELGLRMVLGATRTQVTGLVVRQALVLAGSGLAIGLVGSLMVGRLIQSLLFEVSPSDPTTLLAISMLLLLVGVMAAWLPANRAAKTDPMVALRSVQ
jgi:putative ABC transport system permease protein